MVVAVAILVVDVLICALAVLAGGNDPHRHFREFSLVTWVNAGQLVACAAVCIATYRRRREERGAPATFWLWMAGATAFLALDEMFSLTRTDGVLLSFVRDDLGIPIGMELAIGSLASIRWGDVLQSTFAATLLTVCLRKRRELFRVPAVTGFFAIGAVLLAGALYIDVGPSHAQLVLSGIERLGPILQPVQDTLKLTGFGAILGAFLVAHQSARLDAATSSPAQGRLSSTTAL